MPDGNPLVSEVWEMQDGTGRAVRGVVSEIAPNVITLVSFTGNRFRISPTGLVGGWHFVQPPPPTALRCNRPSCNLPGTMRFQRGTSPEWVCPRHLPVGVQASLTTESLGVPTTPQAAPVLTSICPGCQLNIEAIEDIRLSTTDVQAWHCPACNTRWATLAGEGGQADTSRIMTAVEGFSVRVRDVYMRISMLEADLAGLTYLLNGTTEPSSEGSLSGGFQGVPVQMHQSLPAGVLIRFRLTGTPTFQEPPAVSNAVTQWTRVGATSGNGVSEAVAHALRTDREERAPRSYDTLISAVGTTPVGQVAYSTYTAMPERSPEEVSWVAGQTTAVSPYVHVGQRWTMSGDLIEVTRINQTDDQSAMMVHFKRVADGIESSTALLINDFLSYCRPYVLKSSEPVAPPTIVVLKDEEWEHRESGEVVVIDYLDSKRDLVIVVPKNGKPKSVPFYEFANAKWRKIIRRTSYDRILELEDD